MEVLVRTNKRQQYKGEEIIPGTKFGLKYKSARRNRRERLSNGNGRRVPFADLSNTSRPFDQNHLESDDVDTCDRVQTMEESTERRFHRTRSRLEIAGLLHPDDMKAKRRSKTKRQDRSGGRPIIKKEESQVIDLVAMVRDKQRLMYGEDRGVLAAILQSRQQQDDVSTTTHQPHSPQHLQAIPMEGQAICAPHKDCGQGDSSQQCVPQTCSWDGRLSPGCPSSSFVYDTPRGGGGDGGVQEFSHNEGWYKDLLEREEHQRLELDVAKSVISHRRRSDSSSGAGCSVPSMTAALPSVAHSCFSPELYDLPPPLSEDLPDTSPWFPVNKHPERLLGCESSQNDTNESNEHLYSYDYLDLGYHKMNDKFPDFTENNPDLSGFRNAFGSEKFHGNIFKGFSSPGHNWQTRLANPMAEKCSQSSPAPVQLPPDNDGKHFSSSPASESLSPASRSAQHNPLWGTRLRSGSLAPEGGGRPFDLAFGQVPSWEDTISGDSQYLSRNQDLNTREYSLYPHDGPKADGDGPIQCEDSQCCSLGGHYTNSCPSPELYTSQDSCDPCADAAASRTPHSSSGGGQLDPGPGSADDGAQPEAKWSPHASHENGPGYSHRRQPSHHDAAAHIKFSPKISLTRTEDSYRSGVGGVVRVSTVEGELVLDPRHWRLAHTFTGLLEHKAELFSSNFLHLSPGHSLQLPPPMQLPSDDLIQLYTSL